MTVLQHDDGVSSVWRPLDAAEAWQLKRAYGDDAVYTAGSTLLRTQWEAGTARIPRHMVDLSRIASFQGIRRQQHEVIVGSMATLAELRRNPDIHAMFPLLTEAARNIAAPSIRNLATIGGNIGSLIGDTIPALVIYEAELIWFDGQQPAAQPILDWLESLDSPSSSERLLMQIRLPFPISDSPDGSTEASEYRPIAFYQKVGRREVFTPSVVTVAMQALLDETGRFTEVRLAAAGGQTRAARLERAESVLLDRELTPDLLAELYPVILDEYSPKGDPFASADYRKSTAANIIAAELWTAWNQRTWKE
ncbi:carbon-monoxide dehydrogenase medium subunit [Paenibacillus phyllosphaerae]|uniref:Carbon-monoxide dehydrogenase medium subunit n=1 Tax=Paenibacillus phyllosphaerae TaxID=274593 RepID=A0A7W5AYT9_9BACL|nr:FAD binding domain-containing protein [Paenibacillus phyllosphaerae]MBB3111262.1 carbon-monoxide dehydrogenase medium subunit [Paenibacillus phyllosphaerae]